MSCYRFDYRTIFKKFVDFLAENLQIPDKVGAQADSSEPVYSHTSGGLHTQVRVSNFKGSVSQDRLLSVLMDSSRPS